MLPVLKEQGQKEEVKESYLERTLNENADS